jgi:hypothetical protein
MMDSESFVVRIAPIDIFASLFEKRDAIWIIQRRAVAEIMVSECTGRRKALLTTCTLVFGPIYMIGWRAVDDPVCFALTGCREGFRTIPTFVRAFAGMLSSYMFLQGACLLTLVLAFRPISFDVIAYIVVYIEMRKIDVSSQLVGFVE